MSGGKKRHRGKAQLVWWTDWEGFLQEVGLEIEEFSMGRGQGKEPLVREYWSTVGCCVGNENSGGGGAIEPRTPGHRLLGDLRGLSPLSLSVLCL